MAKVDIGPKIGFDGEREFRQELAQINQGLKTLSSESKAVSAAMQDETNAEKKAAAEKDVLNRMILTQMEKLEKLEKGLKEAAVKYGEADTRTQKWQQAVYDATAEMSKMERELKDTDKKVEDVCDSMDDASKSTSGWADVMKGTLFADAIKAGFTKLADWAKDAANAVLDISKAGAEYADNFLTLETTSGVSIETLQEFSYMEGLADISTETLADAITELKMTLKDAEDEQEQYNKKMAEAAKETDADKRAKKEANIELGETAANLKNLGVKIKDNNGNLRKSEDVFFDLVSALGKMDDETKRDAISMELLGESATELNTIIALGEDALADMRQEAHDTGYVLSGPALEALHKQQDAMDRFDKKTEALSNRFATALAPSMESAYDKMTELVDSPVIKMGIDDLGEDIGSIVESVTDIASDVLPSMLKALSSDPAIRVLSEQTLDLMLRTDEAKKKRDEMLNSYNDRAGDVLSEKERLEDIWKQLEKITDESGNVKKADKERAKVLLDELNEALGTEFEMNGNLIEQYDEMKNKVYDLIQAKTAESLLSAFEDRYKTAYKNRETALADAGAYLKEIEDLQAQIDEAQAKVNELDADWNEKHPNGIYEGGWLVDSRPQGSTWDYKLRESKAALDELMDKYNEASETAYGCFDDIYRYETAQAEIVKGNHEEAIRLLADDTGATIEHYKKKKELDEQDKKDLREKIKEMEASIEQYKKFMDDGAAWASKEGLEEMQRYVDEAKKILDGKAVGEHWLDGLITGVSDKKKKAELNRRMRELAKTQMYDAVAKELGIASPAKKAIWMGEMWDEGLVKGLLDREDQVRRAAMKAAETISDGAAGMMALSPSFGIYNGGATAAPIGTYGRAGGSNSYTTNMGGITIRVDGAGAVNEDALAQRVAVHLTHELQRAQRGGRR